MAKDQQVTQQHDAGAPATDAAQGGEDERANAQAAPTQDVEEPVVSQDEEDLALMLEDARSKADEHWDMVVRAKAEMENLRRRHARELENAHKFALDSFVRELLPVRDSLELGLNAARDDTADVTKLREGTELTLRMLGDAMGKFNIEEVDPEGEPFDPERHQAMSTQPREDVAPNTVVNVIQKGYVLNGRLVRPALVMVSQSPTQN